MANYRRDERGRFVPVKRLVWVGFLADRGQHGTQVVALHNPAPSLRSLAAEQGFKPWMVGAATARDVYRAAAAQKGAYAVPCSVCGRFVATQDRMIPGIKPDGTVRDGLFTQRVCAICATPPGTTMIERGYHDYACSIKEYTDDTQ